MEPVDDECIYHAIGMFLRDEILKVYNIDSCIATTFCGLEILKRYNVPAKPIVIRHVIGNHEAFKLFYNGVIPPNATKEQIEEAYKKTNAHVIGMGFGNRTVTGGKPYEEGHVAIEVDQGILDLTLDQASRDQYNMHFTPSLLEWNDGGKDAFIGGKTIQHFFDDGNKNPMFVRTSYAGDFHGFKQSPNWGLTTPNKKIIDKSLSMISMFLAAGVN